MAIEIERKFLLRHAGWRAGVSHCARMDQGYLSVPGGKSSVRLRLEDERATLNIKAAVLGTTRAEYEYPVPAEDARRMLSDLCVGRVRKTRHYLPQDDLIWEIDEFHDDNEGLVVAEIELPSPEHPFQRPDWLGEEVTDDARYYNHALASHPYRNWDAPRD